MSIVKEYYLYACVAILAFVLRLISIGSPRNFIMDEAYYVPDSISLLKYGYESKWLSGMKQDDVANKILNNDYSFFDPTLYGATHPPLGKMMIALGMIFFGTDSPVGWRIASVFAGTIVVLVAMVLAFVIFRKKSIAVTAGVIIAIDPMAIAMSKTAHLDIFLTMFVIISVCLMAMYLRNRISEPDSYPVVRSWLLWVSFIFLGLATAVKWSGLYYIVVNVLLFVGFNVYIWLSNKNKIQYIRIIATSFFLGLASSIVYFLTWIPYLFTIGNKGNPVDSVLAFAEKHKELYSSHTHLMTKHNYNSNAFEWFMQSRPTLLYYGSVNDSTSVSVSSMPNLIFWFGSIIAIIVTIIFLARKIVHNKLIFVLFAAIVAGWVPWMISYGRTIFQFYTVVFEPYMYILLAFVLYVAWVKVNLMERKINILRMILLTLIFISIVFSYRLYNGSVGLKENEDNGSYSIFTQWQHFNKDMHLYDVNQMPPKVETND